MQTNATIVGLGESLFDIFEHREKLGGAPLNVAVHAHACMQRAGGDGVVVSRRGADPLGDRIAEELAARGMTRDYLQRDPQRETGKVYVTLRDGEPSYEIVENVAWDFLAFDDALRSLAGRCAAVCFGSLAQRAPTSRETIQAFLSAAPQAIRLFDVNLRQRDFDAAVLRGSCRQATAVKLNREELPRVVACLELTADNAPAAQARALIDAFGLSLVAYTRGAEGTVLFTPEGALEEPPVRFPRSADADSVGAGDACSAGLLTGMVLGWPLERTLSLANRLGAYVAAQAGATPPLPEEVLGEIGA